jgi:uncharacterized protein DUF5681
MAKIKCRDGRRNNRPPVDNQFKPGQSGNKKGRPSNKTRRSVNEIVGRLLQEKHSIVSGGRQRIVSFQEVMITKIFEQAYKGNSKSLTWVIELIERVEFAESERTKHAARISPHRMAELKNMSVEELEAEYRRLVDAESLQGDRDSLSGTRSKADDRKL